MLLAIIYLLFAFRFPACAKASAVKLPTALYLLLTVFCLPRSFSLLNLGENEIDEIGKQ
jgi:hypothetical protein